MTAIRGRQSGAPQSTRGRAPWRRRWIAWKPGADTALAVASLLGMWAGYYGTSTAHTPVPLYAAVLTVGTALPAWVIFGRLGGTWADLGITRRRLVVSLLLAFVLGAGSLTKAFALAHDQGIDPIAHLAANLFVFWEPFFYFGWLCLRFERAFGAIAAPFLTGAAFTLMHIGAVPVDQAIGFGAFAFVFAVLMTATRNLAVLWPLAYPVTSAIGTLQSGLAFGWDSAALDAAAMLAQFAILALVARRLGRARGADPAP